MLATSARALLVAACLVAAASCSGSSHQAGPHTPISTAVTRPAASASASPPPVLRPGQTLDMNDGEFFTPLVAKVGERTAGQVWAVYARPKHASTKRARPPRGTVSYLGRFTDGGGRIHAPVYIYFTGSSTPAYHSPHPPKHPPICNQWVVVSETSATMVESSWLCPS
jgi:hypothetical protein